MLTRKRKTFKCIPGIEGLEERQYESTLSVSGVELRKPPALRAHHHGRKTAVPDGTGKGTVIPTQAVESRAS